MYSKCIFILFITFKAVSLEINVENLLIDLRNSSLQNNFPIYYVCSFSLTNINFKIYFKRDYLNHTKIELVNNSNIIYYNYESSDLFTDNQSNIEYIANAVLFLDKNCFLNRSNTNVSYETIIHIYKIGNNCKNIQLIFKIYRNQTINSNKTDGKLIVFIY